MGKGVGALSGALSTTVLLLYPTHNRTGNCPPFPIPTHAVAFSFPFAD